MSRVLGELMPLALPFLLYGLYIWHLKRNGRDGPRVTPWFWLAAIGMTLVIAGMIIGGLIFGETPGQYVPARFERSEEHTSELQSLMRISYAVFCLKKKNKQHINRQ